MRGSFLKFLCMLLVFLLHMQCTEGEDIKCIENERHALLALKQGLKDNYGMLSTWRHDQNQDCCRWKGVQCSNGTGHVEMLDLHGRGHSETGMDRYLTGLINPSLVQLQHLTYLNLSQNDFNGIPIPEFIGNLSKLRTLDLSFAGFARNIPHQLGMLLNLQYLDLYRNPLDGVIPYQLENLSKLRHLDLSFTLLVGPIPHQLSNLSSLQSLNLGNNDDLQLFEENSTDTEWLSNLSSLRYLYLNGMPGLNYSSHWLQIISKLPHLKELRLNRCSLSDANLLWPSNSHLNLSSSLVILDLSENDLASSAIFLWMLNFTFNLRELYLQDNHLEGPIPEGFGNTMKSLAYVDLTSNKLKGQIPNSFGNLCNLQSLYLSDNFLSGELSGFAQNATTCFQHPLGHLDFSDNRICGTLPDLSRFQSLKMLLISGNQLQGIIPESFGLLSELETLDLTGNSLEGVLSESQFTNISKLKSLYLSGNLLAIKFDANWIPSFQLEYLSLASCKLGPAFPKWLETQNALDSLDISHAQISDTVPHQFWHLLSKLAYLNMSHNSLKGTIPDLSLQLSNYPEVTLESNNFEGSIPSFFLKAWKVYLSKNRFTDFVGFLCANIPAAALTLLDASNNQLTGELPNCWHHLQSIEILDLSNNKFIGSIPTTIGNLVELKALILRNNGLTGKLPSSLKNCTNLAMLDVGENNLSGPIPSWVGESFNQLIILSLRGNHFYGSLHLHICYLTNIKLFDVSMNNLTGGIPTCLSNFTAMTQETVGLSEPDFYWLTSGPESRLQVPYRVYAYLMWKGVENLFKNADLLLNSIDLSSNHITGEIPKEIGYLIGLVSLNLSRNNLSGEIITGFGNLKSLEFLDLSRNHLVGRIPPSLAQIDRLSQLDLSNNCLSGRIPTGTQLQSFNISSYESNLDLCGLPLDRKCPGDETPSTPTLHVFDQEAEDANSYFLESFYMSLGLGFAVGFWGLVGPILFIQSWRHAYIRFLNKVIDGMREFFI